jgi:hypothetical protein
LNFFPLLKPLTALSSTLVGQSHLACHIGLTCAVLLRIIRSIVLNDTNFKTIMHHIHRLKDSR